MSLLSSPFKAGGLEGAVIYFEVCGDVLERHYHAKGEDHITVVSSGSVKIVGEKWEEEVSVGRVIDLPDGQWHEIIALENNTKIVNINKG